MEEVSISETESRYFGDLFLCCDAENSGKVPILKATEMFRSANLSNDVIRQITCVAGIPQTAIHMSRVQFYACLKLIAAHQAGVQPLRVELIAAAVALPLPKFSWTSSPTRPIDGRTTIEQMANGSGGTTAQQPRGSIGDDNSTSSAVSSASAAAAAAAAASGGGGGQWRKGSSTSAATTAGGNSSSLRSPNLIHLAGGAEGRESHTDTGNSDLPSTDSEVEHTDEARAGRGKDRHRHVGLNGSPEAWSTASDSPTPTNSVTERPWAQNTLWQGLFCEEQRQLLGTEEESSDRHSSDEDPHQHHHHQHQHQHHDHNNASTMIGDVDLETVFQITPEQRDYYLAQFRTVQPDVHGLVGGPAARIFFEKSRIPVDELRHIWQLCDVTRDGALSLAEFTAAMHLVVLRRNEIPLPPVLPACLNPARMQMHQAAAEADGGGNSSGAGVSTVMAAVLAEPREADLLHLDDDDDVDGAANQQQHADDESAVVHQHHHHNPPDGTRSPILGKSATTGGGAPSMHTRSHSQTSPVQQPPPLPTATAGLSASTVALAADSTGGSPRSGHTAISSGSSTTTKEQQTVIGTATAATAAAVAASGTTAGGAGDWMSQSKEWTKFTESPTSNVSSPGPKPVNFDMQRTAQAVVSDPLILHPVPVRVTPIGVVSSSLSADGSRDDENSSVVVVLRKSDLPTYEQARDADPSCSPSQFAPPTASMHTTSSGGGVHRDSMPGSVELRAIQRPQPKKVLSNVGAIPPPPQRESSVGAMDVTACADQLTGAQVAAMAISFGAGQQQQQHAGHAVQLQAPPPPPPRPHKHARSSSLDLNKLKLNGPTPPQVPPRVSPQIVTQVSLDVGESSSFADFTHFPDAANQSTTSSHHHHSHIDYSSAAATPRNITASLQSSLRSSAFEVYRKPPNAAAAATNADSAAQQRINSSAHHSPPDATSARISAAAAAAATASVTDYERRVAAINDSLRHVSFKQSERNVADVVHHLREQNHLLMQLCSDLTEELATVHRKKEELRARFESVSATTAAASANGGSSSSSTHQLHQHHSIV